MNQIFELIRALVYLSFGLYAAAYVLSDKSTTFESIVVMGLFLIVSRLELNDEKT